MQSQIVTYTKQAHLLYQKRGPRKPEQQPETVGHAGSGTGAGWMGTEKPKLTCFYEASKRAREELATKGLI